ncbi:hypothetical protein CRUP_036693, partial [Coryphaenoides rupestris]
ISAFALAALVLPGSYPHYLDLIHSLSVGPALIGLTKFGIAFPVSYHTFNAISAFALAALVLPGSYPHYLDLIHSLSVGPALIGLTKFGIAFPVSYHTFNGVRHLFWDIGKGFKLPEVYRSGYIVIALSVLSSVALTCL